MTNTDKQELKPCPFCGGKAYFDGIIPYEINTYCFVCCTKCDAAGAGFSNKQLSIAAWNTRHPIQGGDDE